MIVEERDRQRQRGFQIIETLGRKRATIEMREVGWSLRDIAVQCNPRCGMGWAPRFTVVTDNRVEI